MSDKTSVPPAPPENRPASVVAGWLVTWALVLIVLGQA
jgi:hypothetical protein